ncbi:MAG: transporter [Myxococcota bacterium]
MRIRRVLAAAVWVWSVAAGAQELEPRRWSHLPTGSNFLGGGYSYTEGDLLFNPVSRIEDAEVTVDSLGMSFIRTFEAFGHSARVDLMAAYQEGKWEGLLAGVPAETERHGWADPIVRLSVNLLGAPPLSGDEFVAYRKRVAEGSETIVGAAVAVQVPLGEYEDDKLINLGANRFAVRPQLGVVHNRGRWGFELTGGSWFYTDNDDFFGGQRLEKDPLLTVQAHAVYTFFPGLWISGGVAYGWGGESTIEGDRQDDETSNLVFGGSLGIPLHRRFGMKVGYVGTRTQNDTGLDSDSLVLAASVFW